MKLKRIGTLLLCGLLTFTGVIETTVSVMATTPQASIGNAVSPDKVSQELDLSAVMPNRSVAKAATPKAAGDIAINSANFPDPMFLVFVWYFIDANDDWVLSKAERESVTAMYANDLDIKNLKGIGHFPNLTTLHCAGNAITSLDLRQNKKLATVLCDDNKIKTLRVPASVTHLYAKNNQLSAVSGLNKCRRLRQLGLANNLFVKLPNLRSMSSLVGLGLEKNYLTEKEMKAKLPAHVFGSAANRKLINAQIKAQRKIARPTGLKVAKSGARGNRITWKRRAGMAGYQVFVSTSKNGKYKRIATTKGTSFTHKNLKKGTTYHYKVRSYRRIGGTNVFSALTNSKNRRIR